KDYINISKVRVLHVKSPSKTFRMGFFILKLLRDPGVPPTPLLPFLPQLPLESPKVEYW
ncbi:unnamed protein product, partial [marine sediment metagenome]